MSLRPSPADGMVMQQATVKRAKLWLVVFVILGLGLVTKEGAYGGLLFASMGVIAAWRRWGEPLREVLDASRVSWKWSALLVLVFCLTLLNGGHGVAPIGILLVLGWESFPV